MTSDAPARSTRSADILVGGRRIEFEPHHCFACGQLNTHGLQLELHASGEGCWSEISLPERFQGWHEIAHGGIVCTILDEVMAWALVERDSWGLTARLAVEFRRPVRIGVPIRAEGWVVRDRRRLHETAGRVIDLGTGELLATAQATYLSASEDRKRELKARYGFRLAAGTPESEDGSQDGSTGLPGDGSNGGSRRREADG